MNYICKVLNTNFKIINSTFAVYYWLHTVDDTYAGGIVKISLKSYLCYSSKMDGGKFRIGETISLEEAKNIVICDAIEQGFILPTAKQQVLF